MTGQLTAGMGSLAYGQKRLEPPQLPVRNHAPRASTF